MRKCDKLRKEEYMATENDEIIVTTLDENTVVATGYEYDENKIIEAERKQWKPQPILIFQICIA